MPIEKPYVCKSRADHNNPSATQVRFHVRLRGSTSDPNTKLVLDSPGHEVDPAEPSDATTRTVTCRTVEVSGSGSDTISINNVFDVPKADAGDVTVTIVQVIKDTNGNVTEETQTLDYDEMPAEDPAGGQD